MKRPGFIRAVLAEFVVAVGLVIGYAFLVSVV